LQDDPFASVRAATNTHRAQHAGCGAYPYANGPLLGALAAATNARRILELGTALGYTALWFAHGAPDAVIDTIERDARHVKLARANVTQFNLDGHIIVHQSDFAKVLPRLDPGYDIVFFDGYAPGPKILKLIMTLLKTRGLLISANQTLDHDDFGSNRSKIVNVIDSKESEHDVVRKPLRTFRHHAPSGKDTDAYRAAIMDPDTWLTAFVGPDQETALSVKL
jgi:predicted O-methyltransferase YrrM